VGLRTDGLAHIRHASGVMIRQSGQLDPLDVLGAHTVLGNALVVEGHLAEAAPQLEQALALRERLGDAAMADPTLDQSYARYLLDRGRFAEARAWLKQFRDRIAASHGTDHPDVGDASLRIANVYIAEGRFDEAQQELDTVFASQDAGEQVFGSVKHRAQLSRAALLLEQGRADEAQPMINAQLEAAQRMPREDQFRDVLYRLYDLSARAAAQRKQFAHAGELFEYAIALMAMADARHPYLGTTRARFASSLLEQGLINEARRQLDLARAGMQAEAALGPQFLRPLQDAIARLAQAEKSGSAAKPKV
jgi:tetratricopeptide (TPR) repeat protein